MTRAYEEVIDFIAGGCRPDQVADFRPSKAALGRVRYLMGRLKDETITADETEELDSYVKLDSIMSLAKARARERMSATIP
jgi:hypothetical protein